MTQKELEKRVEVLEEIVLKLYYRDFLVAGGIAPEVRVADAEGLLQSINSELQLPGYSVDSP